MHSFNISAETTFHEKFFYCQPHPIYVCVTGSALYVPSVQRLASAIYGPFRLYVSQFGDYEDAALTEALDAIPMVCFTVCVRRRAKAYNIYIAPQAAYRSCRGAVHFTDRVDVQPIGHRLSLCPQTDLRPTALVCRLMVFTTVIDAITRILLIYMTLKGCTAELAWLVDP